MAEDRPIYLRLRDVIADAMLDGRFQDGDALPSVRALAAEHGANPLTVAKAYQSFQEEGLVLVRRGVGMFVAPGAVTTLRDRERTRFLTREWPRVRSTMHRLGISHADLLDTADA